MDETRKYISRIKEMSYAIELELKDYTRRAQMGKYSNEEIKSMIDHLEGMQLKDFSVYIGSLGNLIK